MRSLNINQDDRIKWEEARRNGVGGSDIACIIGVDTYKSNVDLWYDKTGRKKIIVEENPAIIRGRNSELPIIQLYQAFNPSIEVERLDSIFCDDTDEWKLANFDGIGKDEQGKFILEIKTAELRNFSKWENGIPQNYLCQVLWYSHISKIDRIKLIVGYRYFGRTDITLKEYNLPNDDYTASDMKRDIEHIVDKAKTFWEDVQNHTCPMLIKKI